MSCHLAVAIINEGYKDSPFHCSFDFSSIPLIVNTIAGDADQPWMKTDRIHLHVGAIATHESTQLTHHVIKVGRELKRLTVEARR